jgi:hypothetical protein
MCQLRGSRQDVSAFGAGRSLDSSNSSSAPDEPRNEPTTFWRSVPAQSGRNWIYGRHNYWLLSGNTTDALRALNTALPLREAQIDLARIDAVSSRYDEARARLRPLLATDSKDFEAPLRDGLRRSESAEL